MAEFRINAGKYRHVVTFQRLKDVPNQYGEVSKSVGSNWEDAFKARVGIFPISGKELILANMEKGEISHRIYMRYQSGVDSTMRILFGNRIFEIVSPPVNYQEKNWEIQLTVREVESPSKEAF
jgi:SPP1 family predicted phage head-tail adaptor